MIGSQTQNIILRRRMGVLNGKKLNIKPIGFQEGNYLRKFSIATSLHGIIYLGEPKRPGLERIFWIFVLSLVFLSCGYQIKQLYNNWMESEIITVLRESNKLHLTHPEIIPFPGITLCSDLQLQSLEHKTINNKTLNEYRDYEDSINLICPNVDNTENSGQRFINPKTWNLLLNNHRILCEQRVISITWIREKINIPCRYFQPIYTLFGICYSMNMVPFNQLLNDGYNKMLSKLNHTKADIITKANETMWNPEDGFNKNAKPFHLPWKVTSDSFFDSIIMTFNLKKDDLGDHCPQTDTGMMLFLHNPAEMSEGIQPTAYITVNNVIYVTTTFTLRTTATNLFQWKPRTRNCYYQHERILKFFKIYTANNCEIECRANHSLKMCGCVAYYHPRDIDTPICGSASFKCVRRYSNNGYSILNKNVTNLYTSKGCNCLDACTETRYEHNVVYVRRNLTNYLADPDQRKHNKSMIVLYYERKVWSVQRDAMITVNGLLGNIGGSLGLFLGASLVSVFEIIYFFVIRLYIDHWNKSKKKIK